MRDSYALSDNPFAEPGDDDRTIIIPKSSRRAVRAVEPAEPVAFRCRAGHLRGSCRRRGLAVISAARPLLSLLSRLRNVASVPDATRLRERTLVEVRRYEQALRDAKLPLELIRTSHYAICASLDDVVQNTPWGSRGSWADASLVATFHQEVKSGERFFDLLARLCQTPSKFLPAIELMYLCMSLGMQGRYRVSARGMAELDRVREETYLVILRQRGAAEPALSLHWQGVSAPYRPLRAELPVWLTALGRPGAARPRLRTGAARAQCGVGPVLRSALAVPPVTMPVIAREAPPKPVADTPQADSARDWFARYLAPEIKQGLVSVVGTPVVPVIRIQSSGMFDSGRAVVEPKFRPVLDRIGAALKARPGPVHVVGYTDNVRIHTVAFPSNYQLSQARAKAAGAILGAQIDPRPHHGRRAGGRRADCAEHDTGRPPAEPPHRTRGGTGRSFLMEQLSYVLMQLVGRWGSGFAGWVIVSTLIWYIFPIVPALQPPLVRLAAIAVALVIYFAINGAISWRNRRRRKALAAGMADDAAARKAAEDQAEAAEEVAALRARMKEVMARLKRRGWRSRQIYDQPWFVLIGPPGSGKTTALLNSGLHLPLGDDGPSASGVGGTRLCDWWFTDEAVLIDTAGRYTTQDSSAVVDAAGWTGFLDLLRRTRPRQPVNGIIVVLSLPDLANAEASERAAHAKAVRLRLDEITTRLRLRIPVYVMLSKTDQLNGFEAYFDDLDQAGRAQVWGATFPLDKGVESFAPEFRLLLERLEDRLVERLQGERAGERRAMIGQFPMQVASLAEPLEEFLRLAFTGSRLDPAPFLRGVYMTSATQQGTPIDRLTGMLARTFGIDQTRVPELRPVSGRSYFVTRLIREVILGEALLVTRRAGRWPRRQVWRAVGFATIALSLLAGGVLIAEADSANRKAIEQADAGLAAYQQRLSGFKLDPVTEDDLPHTAPVLDAAAALPQRDEGNRAAQLLGLSQGAKLAQADTLIYRHALERILLPRLVWRLEQAMHASFNNPAGLYDTTRVYLMLGGQGPIEPQVVRAWMKADWETRFPRRSQRAVARSPVDQPRRAAREAAPRDRARRRARRSRAGHLQPRVAGRADLQPAAHRRGRPGPAGVDAGLGARPGRPAALHPRLA